MEKTRLSLVITLIVQLVCSTANAQTARLFGINSTSGIYSMKEDGTDQTQHVDWSLPSRLERTSLLESNGFLWGVSASGGKNGYGTIFRIKTDGSDFSVVHHFDLDKGQFPYGSLIEAENKLWGTTQAGGQHNFGVVYRLALDGTGFEVMHHFDGTNGNRPEAGVTFSTGKIWGMTRFGGDSNQGIIYSLNTDGSNYQVIERFDGRNKGRNPYGELIEFNGKLYGATYEGGTFNSGAIFSIQTDGSGFNVEAHMTAQTRRPLGKLAICDGKIWGTTIHGGSGRGTIFSLDLTSGTLSNHHSFRTLGFPRGGLLEHNGKLWGMALLGNARFGGVYSIEKDGSGFTIVNDLSADATSPYSTLIKSNDRLWGLSLSGGKALKGSIFSMDLTGGDLVVHHAFNHVLGTNHASELLEFNQKLWATGLIGGANGDGTLIQMNDDGTNATAAHDFTSAQGRRPQGIVEIDGVIWGMTQNGGTDDFGTIYKYDPNSGFTSVHSFDNTNGSYPSGKLTKIGEKIWGMTPTGGANNGGVLFTIEADGSGFEKLYDFEQATGRRPLGELLLIGDRAFGTTQRGGASDFGAIFYLDMQQSSYVKVHDFSSTDGKFPAGNLIQHGTKVFGTVKNGGDHNFGVLFSLNTDGSGFAVLHHFSETDGKFPEDLFLHKDKLYGTTGSGGSNDNGTLFTWNIETTQLTKLSDFKITEGRPFLKGLAAPNNAPVALTATEQSFTEDASGTHNITLSDFFSDLEEQAVDLTYIVNGTTDESLMSSFQVVNNVFSFELAPNKHGSATLTITAQDKGGKTVQNQVPVVIHPVADIPSISTTSAQYGTLTSEGLVISRNENDGNEVTHFKLLNFNNGNLYLADGVTQLNEGDYVTSTQASAGLRFNATAAGTAGFDVRASLSDQDTGLGGGTTVSIDVAKASLTATAEDHSIVFGEEIPTLTLTYSGFVGSDNPDDLDTKPEATTNAKQFDDVGTYDITLAGGEDNNYTFELINGTLTVTRATAQITLSNLTQDADGSPKMPMVTTDPADLKYQITYNGGQDAPTEPGTYDVVVTLDEVNYEGVAEAIFTLELVLGLEELADVKVFPNPFVHHVNITSDRPVKVRLMDMKGVTLEVYRNPTVIDLTGYRQGMYLLRIEAIDHSATSVLRIEKSE